MSDKGIILTGMAGVGKSTIGASLARTLGFEFIDVDQYIYEKDGKTIQQVVDERGDVALLELEKQRVREVKLKRTVVAPGGSIIYHPDLMEHLGRSAVLVYLHDSLENIRAKLTGEMERGIVGLKYKPLEQIYAERYPLYTRYAHITVDCRGKTQPQIVEEIRRRYTELVKGGG